MDYLKGNNKKQQCMQLSFNKQQHVLKVQFKIVMGLLHEGRRQKKYEIFHTLGGWVVLGKSFSKKKYQNA